MANNEIEIIERTAWVAKMDYEMRNMDDEELVMVWLTLGVPDGSDFNDYREFAEDKDTVEEWTDLYYRLKRKDEGEDEDEDEFI